MNDGMVLVTRSTIAEYEAMSQEERGKTALEAADPSVDFSVFDENGDGAITADELCVVQIFVELPEPYETDGGARSINPVTLDGVQLQSMIYMAYMPNSWKFLAYPHELMHVAFLADDTYGFGTGRLDLMGAATGYVAPSTWHKLHLGWTDPQVVTRDGYYNSISEVYVEVTSHATGSRPRWSRDRPPGHRMYRSPQRSGRLRCPTCYREPTARSMAASGCPER